MHALSKCGVLARGHLLRVRIGGEVEIVGLDTTSAPVPRGVCVDGEEQVGTHSVGQLGAGAERHVGVAATRQDDFDSGLGRKTRLEAQGHVEDERRLGQLASPRAGVVAPVPRVDDDPRHAEPELTSKRKVPAGVGDCRLGARWSRGARSRWGELTFPVSRDAPAWMPSAPCR